MDARWVCVASGRRGVWRGSRQALLVAYALAATACSSPPAPVTAEMAHDTRSANRATESSLQLTIHPKIQAVAEQSLAAAVKEFDADFGVTMVLDVETSELLAVAVAPSLDPTADKLQNPLGQNNLALESEYKPGDPFEVIDLAVRLQEKVPLSEGQIRRMTGNPAIVDDRPQARPASSQKTIPSPGFVPDGPPPLDREKYDKYLRDLGFGQSEDLGGIRGASGQLARPNRWSTAQYRNFAYGQGLSVTPLQMVTAFAAIARGGVVKRPLLIKAQLGPNGTPVRTLQPEAGRRVLDEAVAKQVLEAMHSATNPSTLRDPNSPQDPTGKGQLPNYTVAGRAGIAQQAENGRYSDTHWVSSFMAVTPVEKPRLVILTLIDTPKKYDPAAGRIVLHGDVVAAPVVREVARFALAYLGVPQSSGVPDLDKDSPRPTR